DRSPPHRRRPSAARRRAVRPRLRAGGRAAGARALPVARRRPDEPQVRPRRAARRAVLPERAQRPVARVPRLAGGRAPAPERRVRPGVRGARRGRDRRQRAARPRGPVPARAQLQRGRVHHGRHRRDAPRGRHRELAGDGRVADGPDRAAGGGRGAHRAPHEAAHAAALQRVGGGRAVRGRARADVPHRERAAGRAERRAGAREPRLVRGDRRAPRAQLPPARARAELGGVLHAALDGGAPDHRRQPAARRDPRHPPRERGGAPDPRDRARGDVLHAHHHARVVRLGRGAVGREVRQRLRQRARRRARHRRRPARPDGAAGRGRHQPAGGARGARL
ncbi:MAG: Ion transport 2 domain protein, partial [uncultured Gemmatimonadaceae bacterium]